MVKAEAYRHMHAVSASVAIPGLLLLCGCAQPADEPPDPLESIFSDDRIVVDLTHPLSADMPAWGGDNPFRHDTLSAHGDGAPSMAAFYTPEHHGTHLDAPVHGAMGVASVDDLTARDLFGPAVVIDVSSKAIADPNYELTEQDLRNWETQYGTIPPGAVVLMHSGWASRWTDPAAYFNRDEEGVMHFPGFSLDAAEFLVNQRSIRGVGVDSPSVDPGAVEGFPVHGIVNPAGKYHLENVANSSQLPPLGAFLIVAPVKIEGGSGGPVRIFAVLPK